MWYVCNCTGFCPTLKMFLVKPTLSRYFIKFSVTTPSSEINWGCLNKLLTFQIFLNSRVQFSHFVISPTSVLERLWVTGTAIIYYKCCSVLPVSGLCIESVLVYRIVIIIIVLLLVLLSSYYYCIIISIIIIIIIIIISIRLFTLVCQYARSWAPLALRDAAGEGQ